MAAITLIGVTGYSGGELLRLLLGHPRIERLTLAGRSVEKPTPIGDLYPYLRGISNLTVTAEPPPDDKPELVFFVTPDGVAMQGAPEYLRRGVKVIDFSGDSRLKTPATYAMWYGREHIAPEMLSQAVYGLPELFGDRIRGAQLVANPGCYPTVNVLGLAPAVKHGLIDLNNIICDSKSGISGAGKHPSLAFHLPEMHTDFYAYKVPGHKHTPEIELALGDVAGRQARVTFTPQVIPVSRGILTTIYGELLGGQSQNEIESLYRAFYDGCPFVRVLERGALPQLKHVRGGNFCDIAVRVDDRTGRLIVIAAIDNLGKGASGQAVQNMNLMLGFDETDGLLRPGFYL